MKEVKLWQNVKPPVNIENYIYEMSEMEQNNQLCAVFSDSFEFLKTIRLDSVTDDIEEYNSNGLQCRFIMIGNKKYDLYKPSDIMNIPIPIPHVGSENSCIEKEYMLKDESDDHFDYTLNDSDILIEMWNDDDVYRAIESILWKDGEQAALEEAYKISYKTCSEHGISLSRDVIESEAQDILSLMKMPNSGYSLFEYDEPEDDFRKNDLIDLLSRRVRDCFIPSLVSPLCYIAINMGISERDSFGWERLVAQVAAVGELEYARYLDETLSKMNPFWNAENAYEYGVSLREWAINSREYKWLCEICHNDVPKSKGAYTTAKRKQTKRYLRLKEIAAQHQYELIDDVEKYLHGEY